MGALVGLGWRGWPGATTSDALVMLAGGALVVTAWVLLRQRAASEPERSTAPALTLLGASILIAIATALAWRDATPVTATRDVVVALRPAGDAGQRRVGRLAACADRFGLGIVDRGGAGSCHRRRPTQAEPRLCSAIRG